MKSDTTGTFWVQKYSVSWRILLKLRNLSLRFHGWSAEVVIQSFSYFIFLSSTERSMTRWPAMSWLLGMECCWVPVCEPHCAASNMTNFPKLDGSYLPLAAQCRSLPCLRGCGQWHDSVTATFQGSVGSFPQFEMSPGTDQRHLPGKPPFAAREKKQQLNCVEHTFCVSFLLKHHFIHPPHAPEFNKRATKWKWGKAIAFVLP